MIDDLNKTELTCKVTTAVGLWLDAHGFKPVETEVPMPMVAADEMGWIADVAAVIHPTQTELIELKMLPRRPRFHRDPAGVDDSEQLQLIEMPDELEYESLMGTEDEQTPLWLDQCSALTRFMTCLVEVKTTRADFRGDRKWLATPPADLAYVAVPKGLLRVDEWPDGWGVLEWTEDGVRQLRTPQPRQTTLEHQFAITLAIAIRRDHHTRYARLREEQRTHRERHGEERIITNIARLAKAVLRIARGENDSVEVNLIFAGINKPPSRLVEQLRELWGIAKVRSAEEAADLAEAEGEFIYESD